MKAKLQIEELNQIKAGVLRTELLAGLTFSRVALLTSDGVKREHNRQQARQAYNSVLEKLVLVSLTAKDVESIATMIQRLKSELEKMGEHF